MVSLRCKILVKEELNKLGLYHFTVELGMVEIYGDIHPSQLFQLEENLLKAGLEVLDNKKSILVERIKNLIIEMIHYSDKTPKVNFSWFIVEKLGYNYSYLSHVFVEINGTSINKFIIKHKIEKIKELLLYDELSINEISCKLNYSNVAHLSNQFKKITGLTPTYYRKLKHSRFDEL